jgi:hypothetical protein
MACRDTACEVMSTWKLDAELVVLSACQSGLGRSSGGEGFVGFAQALFLAGGRSLVLSLWEVNDRATALLMPRFDENWLGKRQGLTQPLSKVEAKAGLGSLTSRQVDGKAKIGGRSCLRHEDPAIPPWRSRLRLATLPVAFPIVWTDSGHTTSQPALRRGLINHSYPSKPLAHPSN